MANQILEEAIILALRDNASIRSILGSKWPKLIYVESVRTQKESVDDVTISISVDTGTSQHRLPSIQGTATVNATFPEKKSNGKPYKFQDIIELREDIRDALDKKNIGTANLVVNQFDLAGTFPPEFDLTDKKWRMPMFFEYVIQDQLTIGR